MRVRQLFGFLWETARVVILAVLIIVPIRLFLFQPFFVRGASMEPNFHDGEYLIIDELSYRLREPQRGEVAVFRYPRDPSQFYIKRLIGLPGETVTIRSGAVFIAVGSQDAQKLDEAYLARNITTSSDMAVTLGPDEYFTLGDNRGASSDSRRWGALKKDFIVGRTLLTLWPLEDLEVFAAPSY